MQNIIEIRNWQHHSASRASRKPRKPLMPPPLGNTIFLNFAEMSLFVTREFSRVIRFRIKMCSSVPDYVIMCLTVMQWFPFAYFKIRTRATYCMIFELRDLAVKENMLRSRSLNKGCRFNGSSYSGFYNHSKNGCVTLFRSIQYEIRSFENEHTGNFQSEQRAYCLLKISKLLLMFGTSASAFFLSGKQEKTIYVSNTFT